MAISEESIITIVTAAITAVTTLLGVIVTASISVYTLKKESYNKRVTEERIRWLNKVREDYSIVMGAYELKHAGDNNSQPPNIDKTEYDKRMMDAEIAKYDLISRLRESSYPGNEYNPFLKSVLNKMNFVKKQDPLDGETVRRFVLSMNFMLEKEWDKSKKETK